MLVEYKITIPTKNEETSIDGKGKNRGGVCLHDRALKHIVLVEYSVGLSHAES